MSETHLDLDRLADLLAGEGSDADVAHVAECAGCAGRLDELSVAEVEVAAALATLPAPPMPPELVERLTAAFAAEPPLQDVAPLVSGSGEPGDPGDEGAEPSRTVTPFPAARRRSWTPFAAAAALLVAAGTLGGGLLLARQGDDAATSLADGPAAAGGGGAAADNAGLPTSATGRDYAEAGALATVLPQLLEGGAPPAAVPAPAPAATGGETAPLTATRDAVEEGTAPTSDGDPLARLKDPRELAGCLEGVLRAFGAGEAVRPVALDYAAYGGQPALVVVLPDEAAADKVNVFVVGAGCSLEDDQTRFFTRLDRPA